MDEKITEIIYYTCPRRLTTVPPRADWTTQGERKREESDNSSKTTS